MDEGIVYSNVSIDIKNTYMIYVGAFKYHKICRFFRKPLRNRYGRKVEIIYIFGSFPPSYFKGNYIVLNSKLKKLKNSSSNCYFDIGSKKLNKEASNCDYIKKLIKKILKNQKDLFIYPFKDSPELNLQKKFENVYLLGPKTNLFAKYNSKLFQHELADVLDIPQPRWFLVHSKADLIMIYSDHLKGKKAFVSKLEGAGGSGSAVINSKKDILDHPHIKKENCRYLVSELIDMKVSPSSEAIVANKNEIFFNGIMDQIMKGPDYLGTVYPSIVSDKLKKLIEQYTVKIGKYIGEHGYRGFFGVDFIVDKKKRLYFAEINPRTCGSTLEKVYMHEVTKKKNFPSIPELEFRAVTRNTFGSLSSKKVKKANLSWGVFNVKAKKGRITTRDVLPEFSESDAFKKLKTTTLDFPGNNVLFYHSGRLCKILSVKPTRKEVEKELKTRKKQVLQYIK